MDLSNVNLENFGKKFTYSSDPNPGSKIVMSNGAFAQSVIMLKLIKSIDMMRK